MSTGIIILNGPPSSGKDEIAKYLAGRYGAEHMEVKELLTDAAVRAAGVSRKLWDALYEREYKEIPTPYLHINGVRVSPRQWMIHISEKVFKPLFGKGVFGEAAANKLNYSGDLSADRLVVFSDGGFIEELVPLSKVCYPARKNFHIARIHRYDASLKELGWGEDSRGYLHIKDGLEGRAKDFDNLEGKLISCAEEIWSWYTGPRNGKRVIDSLPF